MSQIESRINRDAFKMSGEIDLQELVRRLDEFVQQLTDVIEQLVTKVDELESNP